MSKFHEDMSIDRLITRWEKTRRRTCPVTGHEVTFEKVVAGQYSLLRISGDSENGYEVCPSEEYLRYIRDMLPQYLGCY